MFPRPLSAARVKTANRRVDNQNGRGESTAVKVILVFFIYVFSVISIESDMIGPRQLKGTYLQIKIGMIFRNQSTIFANSGLPKQI